MLSIAKLFRQALDVVVIDPGRFVKDGAREGRRCGVVAVALEGAGLDPGARPEVLTSTAFRDLARALEARAR